MDRLTAERYRDELARYVSRPDEASLTLAYELGREAIESGMTLLDLHWMHQDSLQHVIRESSRDAAGVSVRAAEFLAEALAPYEMTHRGFQEANRALEASREEAEKANLAKSEFLSRMSHELRTPLNSILGFSQLLQMDARTPEDSECLEAIIGGGKHLLELINEVLDIARIESGRLEVSLEPVGLQELVPETVSMVGPLAQQRNIVMTWTIDGAEDVYVTADLQRLRQALINLLSNAIKYNREGGSVTVAVDRSGQRAGIDVTDTGPGIPVDKQERLWSAFDRLGAEQSEVEGTGLGLALTKHLVELMGGAISVQSRVGEGSTFTVELPVARGAAPPEEQEIEPAVASPGRRAGPHVVLYVEDSRTNLKLVEMLMERRGDVDLVTAMDGLSGLRLAKEKRPLLILLDLHLPDMAGEEVLSRLRADPVTGAIPVVILSADATGAQIDRLRAQGVSDYLTKPFDVPVFMRLLDQALADADAG